MPRIRTTKPEFWSSPGIGAISPWARLLYLAMWNWADDAGRGTCNLRELQGFAFPEDEHIPEVGTSDGFRRTLAEVRGRFGVVFYKIDGRPFYEIPSWQRHQRNERIAKGKYRPSSEGEPWDFMGATSEGAEAPTISAAEQRKVQEAPTTSGPVLKEQRNRGTGEQTSSAPAAPPREDVRALCDRLHERVTANGAKSVITKQWQDEARRLIDIDKRDPGQALKLIDWATNHHFWRSNILSMPTFRKQYDKLLLQAKAEAQPRGTTSQRVAQVRSLLRPEHPEIEGGAA